MAELEAGGYLVQPHTSAGRVPSDAGYRTYVDRLMQPEELGPEERRRIRDELHDASRELDEIIESTTRLLGRLSNNLAFVTKPHQEAQTFKHIQLIWLSPRTGVAIVVTSLGVAAQSLFELAAEMRPDDLTRFSNALNRSLCQPSAARRRRERRRGGRRRDRRARRSARAVIGRAAIRSFERTADDRRGRRAESARPAGVSRLAEAAFDPAHRRRAEDAVRNRRRRDERRSAERQYRSRARQRRAGRPLGRHRSVPLRTACARACSRSSARGACRTRGCSRSHREPPKA